VARFVVEDEQLVAGLDNAPSLESDRTGSLDDARAILELEPRHAKAARLAGTAAWFLDRNGEARDHLAAALALDPEDADALATLADLATSEKKWKEAIALRERSVAALPDPSQREKLAKARKRR